VLAFNKTYIVFTDITNWLLFCY